MFKKIPKGYGLNECPPLREAIALGFTHLPVLLVNTVPIPLLIGGGIGLPASELTILIAALPVCRGHRQHPPIDRRGSRRRAAAGLSGQQLRLRGAGIAIAAQHGLDTFTGACLVGSVVCLMRVGRTLPSKLQAGKALHLRHDRGDPRHQPVRRGRSATARAAPGAPTTAP